MNLTVPDDNVLFHSLARDMFVRRVQEILKNDPRTLLMVCNREGAENGFVYYTILQMGMGVLGQGFGKTKVGK